VVGLLAAVGWLVYDKNHTNKTVTASSTSTSKTTSNESSAKPSSNPVTTSYTKVPADLQASILAQLTKDVPACVKNNQPVDAQGNAYDPRVDYDASGFAGTSIGCGEGSWGIFAKTPSGWKFLAKTQMSFDCSLLVQYHYPKALLALNLPEPQCFEGTTLKNY
jgi:hypothetical protein